MSQAAGYVSAGEVVHLWSRGVRDDELCGCGVRFRGCPFWSEVGRRAFGGWERLDVQDVLALQGRVDRNRYIFFMLAPALNPRYRRDLETYTEMLDALYRAISSCGGGVVVDSSKHASTAFLLRRVPSLHLRTVHLVRDSRGVAHSLMKKVRRPEVVGREAFMHRVSAWRSSIEWVAFNGLFHLLKLTGTHVLRVRYEDLVTTPRPTLTRIGRLHAGSGDLDLAFLENRHISLGVDHTVAGNPMRFRHGSLDLRLDRDWQGSMNARHRRITTMLTAPLLALYGYRLRHGA